MLIVSEKKLKGGDKSKFLFVLFLLEINDLTKLNTSPPRDAREGEHGALK